MADTRRVFQLLDVPKFAYPSLANIDSVQTANNITDRLNGRAFMSYSRPLALIPKIVRNELSAEQLGSMFNSYKEDWKNVSQREVALALHGAFGGKGMWYPVPSKPVQVFDGLWFKPSVRGVWFDGRAPFMVAINPRKHQTLVTEHLAFLARGMHELYGIDDPNDPLSLIVDLSVDETGKARTTRQAIVPESLMIEVIQFEEIMRLFFESLRLAGIEAVPRDLRDVTDMLKRPRP
jgi:hypothetical protein